MDYQTKKLIKEHIFPLISADETGKLFFEPVVSVLDGNTYEAEIIPNTPHVPNNLVKDMINRLLLKYPSFKKYQYTPAPYPTVTLNNADGINSNKESDIFKSPSVAQASKVDDKVLMKVADKKGIRVCLFDEPKSNDDSNNSISGIDNESTQKTSNINTETKVDTPPLTPQSPRHRSPSPSYGAKQRSEESESEENESEESESEENESEERNNRTEPQEAPRQRFFKLIGPDGTSQERYTGQTPKQAASRAFTKMIMDDKKRGEYIDEDNSEKIVHIQESTRGRPNTDFWYKGKRIQLDNPQHHTINVNGIVRTITYNYSNAVTKIRQPDDETHDD